MGPELPEKGAILVRHWFSYEMKPCFNGGQAQLKRACFLFDQHSDDACMLEQAEELTAEEDAYITDKDMTWTYVVAHESAYRPSFCISAG